MMAGAAARAGGAGQVARNEQHPGRSPGQLLAIWFGAVVLVEGMLLTAAVKFQDSPKIAVAAMLAAAAFVPIFLFAALAMRSAPPPRFVEDARTFAWLEQREQMFRDFRPENILSTEVHASHDAAAAADEEGERSRLAHFEASQGLFLVHEWRPSQMPGQVADVIVWLHQDGEGPLTRAEVERVEYHLGSLFIDGPAVKTDPADEFRLRISLHEPILCLARAYLAGRPEPIELARYVSFT
jgi:hypothetical protein